MIIHTIYRVVNGINGKVYIGYTSNFKKRQQNHINSKTNCVFHKAIRKYGYNNFKWQILYQSLEKNHTQKVMENYFIKENNSMLPQGYNTCPGGGGGYSSKKSIQNMIDNNPMFSEDTKNKVSNSMKLLWKNNYDIMYNRLVTKETSEKRKISKLGIKNHNFNNPKASKHLNEIKLKCYYCNIITTKGNLSRWHNDKCKHRTIL
jgi:group I intron endonuclease